MKNAIERRTYYIGILPLLSIFILMLNMTHSKETSFFPSLATVHADSTTSLDTIIEASQSTSLRYLVYSKSDYVIGEANAEDIRTIAVDYSIGDQKHVTIHNVPSASARGRVSDIHSLLEQFGVSKKDIYFTESREYPYAADTVIMIMTHNIKIDKPHHSSLAAKT